MKMPTTGIEWRKWNAMNTKPITNYDRIISKTPEELAEIMAYGYCGYCKIHDYCFSQSLTGLQGLDCYEAWLNWLKEEAKP